MRRAKQQTIPAGLAPRMIGPEPARSRCLTPSPMLPSSGPLLWPDDPGDPDDADALAILAARLHRQGMLAGRRLG